jgi:penicillin V acylase-like amidase (Ntn superfamily)
MQSDTKDIIFIISNMIVPYNIDTFTWVCHSSVWDCYVQDEDVVMYMARKTDLNEKCYSLQALDVVSQECSVKVLK